MKFKVRKYINYALILLVLLLFIVIHRFDIVQVSNSIFYNKSSEEMNLTTEKKVEDFEYLFNVITTSMPMLDSIEETYKINFRERKEYYLKTIKETKNDFEFYCVMSSIANDIPSFHTDLVFPDYNNYTNLSCYHLQEMLCRVDLKPLANYWYSTIESKFKEYKDIKILEFKYIEGKYLFDKYYSSEEYSQYEGTQLVAIDDVAVNEYITDKLSMWEREYDTKRYVPYRRFLTFSSDTGEKVSLKLRTTEGEIVICDAYIDYAAECKSKYDFVFGGGEESEMVGSYYYEDKINNIGYLYLEYFDETIINILSERISEEKVIVDLRNNSGGLRKVISEYLHNKLFADDIVQSLEWYVPKSEANQYVIQGNFTTVSIVNQLFHQAISYSPTKFRTDSISEFLHGHSEITYKGNGNSNKTVYFLIGSNTGSAADGYVSVVKEKGFGKLIGMNTAGEGLGASFCVDSLPNSGLVFIYMPCLAFNPDGTDNSVMGTSPDIYIEQTAGSFYKQRELQIQGEDIFTYQNRMIWDNVFLDTIEMIKNK